jgi:hypothetical protein
VVEEEGGVISGEVQSTHGIIATASEERVQGVVGNLIPVKRKLKISTKIK